MPKALKAATPHSRPHVTSQMIREGWEAEK